MRISLRDNHINKILTYRIEGINKPKYLYRISFINDSGLVVKSVTLSEKGDTSYIHFHKFDNLNREIEFKTKYSEDSIFIYSYEYKDNSIKITLPNRRILNEKYIYERKRNKYITYYYLNDTLSKTYKWKNNKYLNKGIVKNLPYSNKYKRVLKLKEFKDKMGNMTKFLMIEKNQIGIIKAGSYTEYDKNGNITKDIVKYKTYRYKRKYITSYEYNDLNLNIITIFYPVHEIKKAGFYYAGRKYECEIYEYFSEENKL